MSATEWNHCPQCAKRLLEEKQNTDDRPRLACPDGHYIHYANPIPTSIGLVEHEGKYLILKRGYDPKAGEWDLPGGFIEATETPAECLIRELKEETGLEIEVGPLIGVFPSVYGDDGRKILGIAMFAKASTDEVTLSEENTEARWVTLEEMPPLAFNDTNVAVQAARQQRSA